MSEPLCPCCSDLSFTQCCGPLLKQERLAVTAEQLMRSRFSAFCKGNINYLIATHHPSKRQHDDQQTLKKSLGDCQWLYLTLHRTSQGLQQDQQGEVEFTATYLRQGQLCQLRENSSFIKENQQWYYLDGDISQTPTTKVNLGRNDPCYCGSGDKFKKCHG